MEDGIFVPSKIALAFHTTGEEILRTVAFGIAPPLYEDAVRCVETQRRLREMVSIISKIESRFGSAAAAYTWYRSEALSGFSGETAMQLVCVGRLTDVLDYIDAVDAGVQT